MGSFAGYQLDDLQLSSKVERRLASLLDTPTSRSMSRSSTKSWRSERRSRPGSDYKPVKLQDLIPAGKFTTHQIFCIFATPLSAVQLDHLQELREQGVVSILEIEDDHSDSSTVKKHSQEDNSEPLGTGTSRDPNPSVSTSNHPSRDLTEPKESKISKNITTNTTTNNAPDSIARRNSPSDHSEVGLNARILDHATSDQIQEILLVVDDDTTLVDLIEQTTNREFIMAAIKQISDPQLLEELTQISSAEIFYCLRSRYRQLTGMIA